MNPELTITFDPDTLDEDLLYRVLGGLYVTATYRSGARFEGMVSSDEDSVVLADALNADDGTEAGFVVSLCSPDLVTVKVA